MTTRKQKSRPVLVTTEHRGVFVGYTTDAGDRDQITLTNARMVIYWDTACRGVLGIASRGVNGRCRVSGAVERLKLRSVTAVVNATEAAAESWQSEPWS